MLIKNGTKLATAILVIFMGAALMKFSSRWIPPDEETGFVHFGNVQNLLTAFNHWKAEYERKGGDRNLVLSLGWSKGLSAEYTTARGQAKFDLLGGLLSIEVDGLPDNSSWDVWLVDNRSSPGHSVLPEPGDSMVRVGHLKQEADISRLQARLDREAFTNFELDLVVVSQGSKDPSTSGILFGSPSLFQKFYHGDERRRLGVTIYPDDSPQAAPVTAGLGTHFFAALLAVPTTSLQSDLAGLIEDGENIFFNEKFEGNGRTCGTCHRKENSMTIDPDFIATLSDHDPLFVAEFNPDLSENFENPKLMREFGLILENVDGFEDLQNKFVMRGVPHVLALQTSVNSSQGPRTGWSGDGSFDGSLRLFATGAVIQHFTRTLNRVRGVDFRFPTDEELDAVEAFLLSVGRHEDLTLPLPLKGFVAKQGQEVFNDPNRGKCFVCHVDAGANVEPAIFAPDAGNLNFNSGVEDFFDIRDVLSGEVIPPDDGFGTPGNGEFNTPPLVESADTGPFFHNNLFNTIEGAVAFYNTGAFNDSPAGQLLAEATGSGINLNAIEIVYVAGFLRVINALENIRSATANLERAKQAPLPLAAEFFVPAIADIKDGNEVLGILHVDARLRLAIAKIYSEIAAARQDEQGRNTFINVAIRLLQRAREIMIDEQIISSTAKVAMSENEAAKELLEDPNVIGQVVTKLVNEVGAEFDSGEIREVLNDLAMAKLREEFDKLVGGEVSGAGSLPESFALEQNYPNPFNPETEIRFQLPAADHVVIKIVNARGQEIRTLVNDQYEAGFHSVRWDGKDKNGTPVSSGVYLYQLQAGAFSKVMKMSLVR